MTRLTRFITNAPVPLVILAALLIGLPLAGIAATLMWWGFGLI